LRAGGGAAKLGGVTFDCRSCGACCCNPEENRAEGFLDYVEVEPGARLWRRLRILDRYTVANARGERHLKLVGDEQRCAALEGAIGRHVKCAVYDDRPRGCRRVEPGDARCLKARAERGISPSSALRTTPGGNRPPPA
jgi:Fe-S-cluster containining protein